MPNQSHAPRSSPKGPANAVARDDDRRSSGRSKVDVLINRFLGGHPYLCVARDVSESGMRFRPLLGPEVDTRYMGLQFQLPGEDEVLTASGEMVREASGEVSVKFTHLPASSREALGRFLAHAA
jgi:hypothetical protein